MTLDKNDDKRRFHRIFYHAGAVLTGSGQTYPCKIVDLSLRGCLLDLEQSLSGPPDTLYSLKLDLSEEISITMEVMATHAVDNRVGFKCVHIDIDSISRLRRLVELNLGDSELLERELAALSDLAEHQ
ncbi:PilZ domain-containing protein [Methylomonas albis]|uniref:Cyclic diguanosine monophosphate-binding protein n=1 Tax=Methylomonas albis TaxID=1854563 RepID=A0ABR9D255_9GAMM|nr:PilZ domain-containing protein [Methylomonas albis]MBD9357192.1 PilZ domain-containing protein [Methylomonas albis]